ncbi:hypothetical protein [Salinicoccus roseus]|uniref:hypothetical protein n=1 Tax=Salinicoccus roseus TaxID=45670 RepID=UPI003DA097E1
MITVKRQTNWIGTALPLTIKLDGEKVGKVKFDEETEIDLPSDGMELSVSQSGGRSNKLIVNDGDTVVIKSAVNNQVIFFMFLISVIAITLILSEFFNRLVATSIAAIILIASFFVLEQFKIGIITEARPERHLE